MMASENVLLQPVEYQVEETGFGVWRRFLNAQGQGYAEFTSHRRIMGVPLVHYTAGKSPETGQRKVARGIIAIGRVAVGFVAIGQAAFGVIAIGQAALGLALGLGQASTGALAVGQAAAGGASVGQFAVGGVTVAQTGLGYYVRAQVGAGVHVWDTKEADPRAVSFFRGLIGR